MSQNLVTNDYTIVFYGGYCEHYCKKCCKEYTVAHKKWCQPCQINYLKTNFVNWTSGNKLIDNFIQEMQLKIEDENVLEWIPYNQFSDIKEIGKNGFDTIYSAIWENGPLNYDRDKEEFIRKAGRKVTLKCLYNSQITTAGEFSNKVSEFSISEFKYSYFS
jgi:hypothetical protein